MRSHPSLRLLLIGALAAATLAGCGRKGPLDAPPGAWVTQQGQAPHAGANAPAPAAAPVGQAGVDPVDDSRPIAPPGPNRRIPADWLLD